MSADSIHLILPADSLPAEGCEPGRFEVIDGGAGGVSVAGDLLSRLTALTQLVGDDALVLKATPAEGRNDVPALEMIAFSVDEKRAPHVEIRGADELGGWSTKAYARALQRYQLSCESAADGTPCERFAECLAIAFNEQGEDELRRVPLLAERKGKVIFYGVWEAQEEDLKKLAANWSGDAASGWIPVSEGGEVEGRGFREMALGLTALSLIATSFPGRALGNPYGNDAGADDDSVVVFSAADFATVDGTGVNDADFGISDPVVVSRHPDQPEESPREIGPRPQAPSPEDSPPASGAESLEDSIGSFADEPQAELEQAPTSLNLTVYDAPNSKQSGARIDLDRLAHSNRDNSKIVIDVASQRAYFVVEGVVIGDAPVSTARRGKYTPRGTFQITQKKVDKVSTIYHVALPYWMRLDQSAIGLHVGDLPGHPASAGCIRLPKAVAQVLYSHMQSGTAVEVMDAWSGAPNLG